MQYKFVFTSGYDDDIESLARGIKSDVLVLDSENNYYNINFMTIQRIQSEFTSDIPCYWDSNMIILHEITKENILNSVEVLHKILQQKEWSPISEDILVKYYYPKSDWVAFDALVSD